MINAAPTRAAESMDGPRRFTFATTPILLWIHLPRGSRGCTYRDPPCGRKKKTIYSMRVNKLARMVS